MSKKLGAFVVWHSHEYVGTPHLVITDNVDAITERLAAEQILTAMFEPDKDEQIDTVALDTVHLVVDGAVTRCNVYELINTFDPDTFAQMGWHPGDVQSHRPHWSDEKARNWLQRNSKHLRDRLAELGNQVIEDLLPAPQYHIEFSLNGNDLHIDLFKEGHEEPEISWNQQFTYREGTDLVSSREHFARSFLDTIARSYGVSQQNIVEKQAE